MAYFDRYEKFKVNGTVKPVPSQFNPTQFNNLGSTPITTF